MFFSVKKINRKCPILIACSALVSPKIEEKALNHGFDLCVQSPLTIKLIKENIFSLIFNQMEEKNILEESKIFES